MGRTGRNRGARQEKSLLGSLRLSDRQAPCTTTPPISAGGDGANQTGERWENTTGAFVTRTARRV